MRCPICLGRFFLRSLPCGHFLCSYCILSVRFRQFIPTDAAGCCPQCANCHKENDFRRVLPPAIVQNAKVGTNVKNGTFSRPTNPTVYELMFSRPCGSVRRMGADGGGERQRRTTAALGGMRTLRHSRIFPTMEKRANGSAAVKYLCPEWVIGKVFGGNESPAGITAMEFLLANLPFPTPNTAEGTEQSTKSTTTTEAQRQNYSIRTKVGPISAPIHSVHRKNSLSDDGRRAYDEGRTYFAALVGRFDAALNSMSANDQQKRSSNNGTTANTFRKNADLLLLSAKEHLCKSEQRIWRDRTEQTTNGRPLATDWCHQRRFHHQQQGNNDRSVDREFGVVRRMLELVVAMEEYNRRDGQSVNAWQRMVRQAMIQMLALSVLLMANFGDCDRNLALLKRHISLLGIRMNGRSNEKKAEEVMDALTMCSTHINNLLERRVISQPSHLISATAHVQFCLFNTMDEMTHQLLEFQTEKRTRVWQMVNRCFGELFQMENLNWRSNEFPWKRFTLIAHLAKFLHQFADVCDTSTQMLCIIEVEKSRAFVAEEVAMSGELRAIVREQITQIELELAECQRIQKWNELKLGTQIVRRKDGREMGRTNEGRRNVKMREWVQRVFSGGRKLMRKKWTKNG